MTIHAGHETVEALAALILSLAGAVILLLAARDRRSRGGSSPLERPPAGPPAAGPPAAGQAVVCTAVTLSLGAAAIHLAAGPEHIGGLGELGFGFYAAALFQAGWALAYLARPRTTVAWIGIAGNAAIIAAWAWTRTIGLPVGPEAGHPEAVGIPDAVATILQLGLVALLLAHRTAPRGRVIAALARTAAANATVMVVPLIGIVFLATTIAVSIEAGGDHGAPGEAGHPIMGSHIAGQATP